MAQLSLKEGNLLNALKSFQHVREYSNGAAHHVELGQAIIDVSDIADDSDDRLLSSLTTLHL